MPKVMERLGSLSRADLWRTVEEEVHAQLGTEVSVEQVWDMLDKGELEDSVLADRLILVRPELQPR
jgi:hypothetical protein